MAKCYELESCYPDLNPTLYTITDLQSLVGKYVKICEGCYLVKQSTTGSCPNEIALPQTSYNTCAECYGTIEALCNTCPEYYTQTTLDDGTIVCQTESSYPATWTGDTAVVENGDNSAVYSSYGLNLLENVTNKQWPIVGAKFFNFTEPTCNFTNPSYDGPGFYSNWGFKDNWGTGDLVYGQTGYSLFSNTPTGSKTLATDTNLLFRSNNSSSKGRLNTAGIWASLNGSDLTCGTVSNEVPLPGTIDQWIKGNTNYCDNSATNKSYIRYDVCFNVTQEKEYLIGFAADNAVRILLDNQQFFALTGQSATSRYSSTCTNFPVYPSYNIWHLVPITLSAGVHTITLIGYNDGSSAAYAAEVYNLTSQELKDELLNVDLGGYTQAVTALEPYIIFSTKNFLAPGAIVPVGEGQWACADGSEVDPCSQSGQPECSCITLIPRAECCYKLTDCQSSTEIYTNTDLVNYQGQYVNIDGGTECYLVEQLNTSCPDNTQDVQVTQAYSSCETCIPSYKLFNCKDQNINLQTANTSFEQYLTKTVKLQEYPNDCWQVGPNPEKSLPFETLTVTQSFETCIECNPPTYGLTNCVNGVSVLSTADLSTYVGKVIKAENFPGLCFSVTESLCKCLKITINNQPYSINATENNLINGRPYFQFTLQNGDPMTISYSATNNQWEAYNSDTGVLKFYTTMDIDCPATGYWVRDDETFTGNMSTETCPLSILNISPSEQFNSCEPCVNC